MHIAIIETNYIIGLRLKYIFRSLLVHYPFKLQREIMSTAQHNYTFQGQPFH